MVLAVGKRIDTCRAHGKSDVRPRVKDAAIVRHVNKRERECHRGRNRKVGNLASTCFAVSSNVSKL